jgi:hypothetical protein
VIESYLNGGQSWGVVAQPQLDLWLTF